MTAVYDFDPLAVVSSFDESIEMTKSCLVASLENIEATNSTTGIPVNIVSNDLLMRPPFTFIYALVKVYVKQLSFAKGLYDDTELLINNNDNNAISLSRQEKVSKLVK